MTGGAVDWLFSRRTRLKQFYWKTDLVDKETKISKVEVVRHLVYVRDGTKMQVFGVLVQPVCGGGPLPASQNSKHTLLFPRSLLSPQPSYLARARHLAH